MPPSERKLNLNLSPKHPPAKSILILLHHYKEEIMTFFEILEVAGLVVIILAIIGTALGVISWRS